MVKTLLGQPAMHAAMLSVQDSQGVRNGTENPQKASGGKQTRAGHGLQRHPIVFQLNGAVNMITRPLLASRLCLPNVVGGTVRPATLLLAASLSKSIRRAYGQVADRDPGYVPGKGISSVHYVRRALIAFTLLAVAAFQPAASQSFIIRDLGALPGGYNYSNALGINERGQVVGYSITAGGNAHACLFEKGVVTDLGTFPGGSDSTATAVNNRGQVVGSSSTARGNSHAFLFEHGVMTDLGTLPAGDVSRAAAINERGHAVGYASNLPGYVHAALFENGAVTDLGTLPGGSDTGAFG